MGEAVRFGSQAWRSVVAIIAWALLPLASHAAPTRSVWADARIIAAPGCNAVAFSQLPGETNQFVGRFLLDAKGQIPKGFAMDCSGGAKNRWALTLNSLDWGTGRMTAQKAVLDTSTDPATGRPRAKITGGPFAGAYIESAYDPSVVTYRGEVLVSFECILPNGGSYGVDGTSTCVGVYDRGTQSIDLSRTTVAVSGHHVGGRFIAGAVGKLLVWRGGLYVYWSSLVVDGANGKFQGSTTRGAQLALSPQGWVVPDQGGKVVLADTGPVVWGPVAGDPLSDTIVDVRQLWSYHGSIYALAALGGSGCSGPQDGQPGCFRLAAARATQPLGVGVFHQVNGVALPTNPEEYGSVVRDPTGRAFIMGQYFRPPADGVSDRDSAPDRDFWAKSPTRGAMVMFPADLGAIEK
jgi:hypothetical protein